MYKILLLVLLFGITGCRDYSVFGTGGGTQATPESPGTDAGVYALTKSIDNISATQINISGLNLSSRVLFYEDSSCSSNIGTSTDLISASLTSLPLNTTTLIYARREIDGVLQPCESTGQSFTHDNIGPTVNITGTNPLPINSSGTASFNLSYSGATSINLTDSDLSVMGANAGCTAVVTSVTSPNSAAVSVTGCTGDGVITLAVASGTAVDSILNLATAPAPSANVSIDNTDPTVSLNPITDPSYDRTITLSGLGDATSPVSENPVLTIHQGDATCSNSPIVSSDSYILYTGGGIPVTLPNLSTTTYHAKLVDQAGNESCSLILNRTHTIGPVNAINSSWDIEKRVVSRTTPESNNITFTARDENNNLITGMVVSATLEEQISGNTSTLNSFTEISTGVYRDTSTLNRTYDVTSFIDEDLNGNIDDLVGVVYASDEAFCYSETPNRVDYDEYNEEGSGTLANPYLICHAAQLKDMADHCRVGDTAACNVNYRLMNNIYLTEWYSQGTAAAQEFIIATDTSNRFSGEFDGNDLSILDYRYTQSGLSFVGMFQYGAGFTVKDLTYSYATPAVTDSGGLFGTINTSFDFDNVAVSGVITGGNLGTCGGLFQNADVAADSYVRNSDITTNTISCINSGGIAQRLRGIGAAKIYLSNNKISHSYLNNTTSHSNALIGGIAATAENVEVDDLDVSADIDHISTGGSRIGGFFGNAITSNVRTSKIFGYLVVAGVDGVYDDIGGIAAFIDGSTIKRSVSLFSINVNDCTGKCGRVVGDTINDPVNSFEDLYSGNFTFNLGAGFLNSSVVETEIDLTASPAYFNDFLNPPLDLWNQTIWESGTGNYVELISH